MYNSQKYNINNKILLNKEYFFMKLNVAVIFGHMSCEHDISIITACQLMRNLDSFRYNIIPIYITKDNKYITSPKLANISNFPDNVVGDEVTFSPNSTYLYKKSIFGLIRHKRIDVAVLCMHGRLGEDGAMQGLFEMNGIPYTSTSIIGSACGANKIVFKEILKGIGIPTAKSMWISDYEYHMRKQKVVARIIKKLGKKVIIKPNSLGSSIGISVCEDEISITKGLKLAFELDDRVLVEEYIEDIKEVNIATFYTGTEYIFSDIEEAEHKSKFLSFEEKYINGHKSSRANAVYLGGNTVADITSEQKTRIKMYTKRLYDTLNLKGIVRYDYMISGDRVLLNEINTIPGSLANYLFKSKGLSYNKLLDELINSAIVNNSKSKRYTRTFNSTVLKGNCKGVKK